LLPMILSFQIDAAWLRSPLLAGAIIFIVACLLVSRLPTYSFKNFRIQHRMVLFTMLGVGILAALSVSAPWLTLSIVIAAYIISFPFAIHSFRRLKSEADEFQKKAQPVPAELDKSDEGNGNQATE
jgi:CDP-diacylglycerol--serine O-phosphatidyltransferase